MPSEEKMAMRRSYSQSDTAASQAMMAEPIIVICFSWPMVSLPRVRRASARVLACTGILAVLALSPVITL